MIAARWRMDRLTPDRAYELTECEIDGKVYSAVSGVGSGRALCRELVAAGVPDDLMEVRGTDGKVQYAFASIHEAAKWT